VRLFVAIELSTLAKTSLAAFQDRMSKRCSGVRWVKPEHLHLTVQFLGEVADERVGSIGKVVRSAGLRCKPIELRIVDCGCFPIQGAVRVVWSGVHEPTGRLLRCVDQVAAALENEGFARERRAYSPHITLGRVRHDRSAGKIREAIDRTDLRPIKQSIDTIALMSSLRSPSGATYTVVSRAKLAGGGEPVQKRKGT